MTEAVMEIGSEFDARQTRSREPLPRASFIEEQLDKEPDSDRKIILEDGTAIRERLTRTDERSDGIRTEATDPVASSFTLSISSALLDEGGKVVLHSGRPLIAPAHEITLTNEALGRLGTQEAVEAAIADARQVAAAKSEQYFKGAALALTLDRSAARKE